MTASVYKTLYTRLYIAMKIKNLSVDKLYKDLADYMHLLFESMTQVLQENIYVFSSPYFAINININLCSIFFANEKFIFRFLIWKTKVY